jgi:hypothetical protein
MMQVHVGSLLLAAFIGSVAILAAMYYLLPALGLPRLDFTTITAGWVRAQGRFAREIGLSVFLAGSLAWTLLYAAFFPLHNVVGGMIYSLIPFGIAVLGILPKLYQYRIMIQPMPGFIWVKVGGPNAIAANLIEHLLFGICLGLFYR